MIFFLSVVFIFSGFSLTSVTGVKLLRMPEGVDQFSFNWWLSNGNPALDFGPRKVGTPDDPFRDFGGHLGTPTGDRNKHYIMRHQEFDYDQLFMAINHLFEGWLPPPANAVNLADGYDTRYLLSFGPFDIEPGEAVPFTFAYVGGENFHTDCEAFDNLFDPHNPYPFYDQLNFSELARNAIWASWAFDTPGVDTDGDGYSGKARWCNGEIMWYEGDGVPDLYPFRPPPRTRIFPEPQHIIMAQSIDPITDTIILGNVYGYNITDIDPNGILINGVISPVSTTILPSYPDFIGEVMQILFSSRDFIQSYGMLLDTASHEFTVTGQYLDATPFNIQGKVVIIGHRSGDMNGDGSINNTDIIYLINYLYMNGPEPIPSIELGDYNRDGVIDLGDIIDLIGHIYMAK